MDSERPLDRPGKAAKTEKALGSEQDRVEDLETGISSEVRRAAHEAPVQDVVSRGRTSVDVPPAESPDLAAIKIFLILAAMTATMALLLRWLV